MDSLIPKAWNLLDESEAEPGTSNHLVLIAWKLRATLIDPIPAVLSTIRSPLHILNSGPYFINIKWVEFPRSSEEKAHLQRSLKNSEYNWGVVNCRHGLGL